MCQFIPIFELFCGFQSYLTLSVSAQFAEELEAAALVRHLEVF